MKKIIALVLALALVLASCAVAFADTATVTKDTGVEIIGLETGDSVKLYKVLQWNTNTGWGTTTAFASLPSASVATLAGTPTVIDKDGTVTAGTAGVMNSTIAGQIKAIYDAADPAMTASYGPQTAAQQTDGYGVVFTDIDAGLYMAIITPPAGNNIVSYNPVFVACDYSRDNDGSLALVSDLEIANVGYAKKTTNFEVDKQVKDGDTSAWDEWATAEKDEVLQFSVDTTIPSYHANEWDVAKISYAVKDSLNGLAYVVDDDHPITVQVKAVGSSDDFAAMDTAKYTLTDDADDATINGKTGLKLVIKPAYLKEITGPMSLKVTYYAKVTDAAITSVSATDNKVTVEYSNNPDSATSKGTKHDVTNHYKFALDAELFGDSEYHTSELVKVGLKENGDPIIEKKDYSNYSTHSPLAAAKFGLYGTVEAARAAIGGDGTGLTSGDDGRFLISNLDVGTYYLVETKAPDGYIRDQMIYKIVISATSKSMSVDDGDCTYTTDVLDTYTVSINTIDSAGAEGTPVTSKYTMSYGPTPTQGEVIHTHRTITLASSSKVVEATKDNHEEDNSTEIKNTKGVELPSTGGIGTTIFYIVGGLLLVGAAVILVARKKSND